MLVIFSKYRGEEIKLVHLSKVFRLYVVTLSCICPYYEFQPGTTLSIYVCSMCSHSQISVKLMTIKRFR